MYMYFLALFFSQANKPISYEGLQLIETFPPIIIYVAYKRASLTNK